MIKLFQDSKRGYYMTQNEFAEKAKAWVQKDRKTWTHITMLAYFCVRYKEKHGVNFRFARWNGAPAKTKESRDFSKLLKEFLPENYISMSKDDKSKEKIKALSKVYNYINWMFDYKFRMKNEGVTGTGIFLNHNILNHFERMWVSHKNKEINSNKVEEVRSWIQSNFPDFLDSYDFQDLKDLKIVFKFIEENSFDESTSERKVLSKYKEIFK